MKKALVLISILVISLLANAQSNKTIQELGLTFSNIDQFGLTYRIGTKQALWRFNALNFSGTFNTNNTANTNNTFTNNLTLGFSIGREYRMPINKRVDFRIGADLMYNYTKKYSETLYINNTYNSGSQTQVTHLPGFNFVFGLNLKLKAFIIGAELKPSFQYGIGTIDETEGSNPSEHKDLSSILFSASNYPVQFSMVYPF